MYIDFWNLEITHNGRTRIWYFTSAQINDQYQKALDKHIFSIIPREKVLWKFHEWDKLWYVEKDCISNDLHKIIELSKRENDKRKIMLLEYDHPTHSIVLVDARRIWVQECLSELTFHIPEVDWRR
jgi:hypothetical protein